MLSLLMDSTDPPIQMQCNYANDGASSVASSVYIQVLLCKFLSNQPNRPLLVVEPEVVSCFPDIYQIKKKEKEKKISESSYILMIFAPVMWSPQGQTSIHTVPFYVASLSVALLSVEQQARASESRPQMHAGTHQQTNQNQFSSVNHFPSSYSDSRRNAFTAQFRTVKKCSENPKKHVYVCSCLILILVRNDSNERT